MRVFLICLFFILIFSYPIHSQKVYTPGYIILNNGDKLEGKLQDRNLSKGKIYDKIWFRNETGKLKKYSPYEIKAYKIGDTEYESAWYKEYNEFFVFHYASKEKYGEKVFLRVLKKGYLSCYYREYIDPDSDSLEGFELFKREGDDYFARVTQGILGLKKKRLAEYFEDCPGLVEKIDGGEITQPLEVVEFYNSNCHKKLYQVMNSINEKNKYQ